ncbi:MAG: glycosyltransferase [Deltaproteobacteria bacterium]|nr:glycosyltransferase [Deltaproteobacteria bacterium]MBW2306229.1 glycosyltransferase [Deltaproteobacteria bacterium]
MTGQREPLVSVIIPVHNEAQILLDRVRSILETMAQQVDFDYELILVENGSTDGTSALVDEAAKQNSRVRALHQPLPNYGSALKEGMLQSRGRLLISCDIDYYDAKFMRVVYALMAFDYDIIIGSKNSLLSRDNRTFLRKFISQGFRMVLHILFGLRVSDTHGMKGWRWTKALEHIVLESPPTYHVYDTELIIRAQRAGLKIMEIPVEVSETRKTDRPILARIPAAVWEILQLRARI